MLKESKKLAQQITIAMILAVIIGMILNVTGHSELVSYIAPIGTIFLKSLKMIIVPIVFCSIYLAMVNLGTPEELGSIGIKAIVYYFLTTALAAFIGLIMVNLINPGDGVELASKSLDTALSAKLSAQKGLFATIMDVVMDAIPENIAKSMAEMKVLQIIVFAVFFGGISLYYKKDAEPFIKVVASFEKLNYALVHFIMKFAPIGIFVLLVKVLAETGSAALVGLGKYMATVIIGLVVHAIILVIVGGIRSGKGPMFVLKGLMSPMFTAFSTASSAATLPITMASVTDNLGVEEKTANFVLPLGATINMDGTALYESVAVIFIAQATGFDLSISQQFIVFFTASLAAIGAAAIPGAGLITMSIVLSAVGMPLDGIALILAVDRILDMFRTAVNVLGDGIGTVVVDSFLRKRTT